MNSITKLLSQSLNRTQLTPIIASYAKYSSYKSSPFVSDLQPTVKYEISKDPHEWSYVQRLLPPKTIPKPQLKDEFPSGWKPQTEASFKHSYFIKRTRNHMIPVYTKTTFRGMRKITQLKNIEGDIWKLEKELKEFLQPTEKRPITTQVHEFAGYILFHGDHVNAIKYFLNERSF